MQKEGLPVCVFISCEEISLFEQEMRKSSCVCIHIWRLIVATNAVQSVVPRLGVINKAIS